MKIAEVRHLDRIKGNFMVSEKEYLAPTFLYSSSDIASQAIYSNLREIVEQQNYIFDTLWNEAVQAIRRIRDIEYGADLADIEVFQSAARAREVYLDLVKHARSEILFIFSTRCVTILVLKVDS